MSSTYGSSFNLSGVNTSTTFGVSESTKRMMTQVTYDKSGKPNIGDRYINELKRMGIREVPKEIRDKKTGGMYAG